MFVVWIGTMMESSLRIRRVHSHKGAVESTHRIIPPHTEGTADLSRHRDQSWNHPSAYGGYIGSTGSSRQGQESSLRIRRVLRFCNFGDAGEGIIPPHTEGTRDPQHQKIHTQNHPSAYGGYICSTEYEHGTLESSLRIRRVLCCADCASRRLGIIPPHTEGTALSSQCWCDRTNHPSAYGGYTKENQRLSVVDG